ncbi:MAG: cell division protein FtsA [Bacteroidota bacterium]
MESSEIIVGLDIGTTKIAAIVGRQNQFGKIEILGYGSAESIGVKRGVVINIDNTVDSIKMAVKEAESKSGVNIKCINVGIAGQHIKSIQHRGSIIRNNVNTEINQDDINRLIDDMYRLVMQPGEEIVHVIPQEYIVDKETGIKKPIGMAGVCLEANFHIITGLVSAVQNISRCVDRAGLEIVDQILEPLASADAVLSEEEKEAGVVLVDIGGGTTDIAIFQDDILRHTAVIPLGGDIITEDIKEGCTIIKKNAEKLKVLYGSALASESKADEFVSIPGLQGRPAKEISLKNLASIIEARMSEILEYVYNEIRSSGYERKLIAGIVLTGGGAQLKNIVQLTEFLTGMDTRIGYPNHHLSDNVPEEMALPKFATGIGLVIRGFDKNLQSPEPEKPKDEPIQNHSKKTKGTFFDSFFSKSKKFFDDDVK